MARSNAGTSLVSGIQDISAFLPIIGTNQCEKHVGEALEGGFLYAAATPLSMFGSLGIVKASAAILVASISPRFAQMLADSGFKLEGSVAAMIGTAPASKSTDANGNNERIKTGGGPRYLAAGKFQDLLNDQHINTSQLKLVFDYSSWNRRLCISTALLACLSITPYIRLIMDYDSPSKSFPVWAPPLMRILGSAISVVVAQMIIQIQMQRILQMTLDRAHKTSLTSVYIPKTPLHDAEKGDGAVTLAGSPPNTPDGSTQPKTAPSGASSPLHDGEKTKIEMIHVPSRIRLALLQVLLFIGIASTAVGYLGCFIVVQDSKASNTYIWLGVEIALAILRIYIWGLNPQWDEHTGLSLELQLPSYRFAPTVTTAQDYELHILGTKWNRNCGPFVVLTDGRFLDYISQYTGPVERFNDPDNHVAIYYTLAGCLADYSDEGKILLTTVLDLETRNTFVFLHHCPSRHPSSNAHEGPTVYSATFEIIQDTGIMAAKCGVELHGKHEFRKTARFGSISEHSQAIANRIGGIDRVSCLHVSWGLGFPKSDPDKAVKSFQSPLTDLDKEYLGLQRLAYLWRRDFDQERDLQIVECMLSTSDLELPTTQNFSRLAVAMEHLLNYECAVFEKHLVAKTTPRDAVNHIFYQYARRLEIRLASEPRKQALARRLAKYRQMVGPTTATDNRVFPDISTRVSVAMNIDDDTLESLQDLCVVSRALKSTLVEVWKLEKQQMDNRLTIWKNCGTSSNADLAETVFSTYPGPCCAIDPELFQIMVARGCRVFDFACDDMKSFTGFPEKITDVLGVSLLRCPARWLPQLTKLAQSNPTTLSIELPDSGASELQMTLEEHRREWGASAPIANSAVISYFCFSARFAAAGTSMNAMRPRDRNRYKDAFQSAGVLLVKTAQGGTLRVALWHCSLGSLTRVFWRLGTAGNAGLAGTRYIPVGMRDEFRRDWFTVEVPGPGVHQIEIAVQRSNAEKYSRYALRKVWVTLAGHDKARSNPTDGMGIELILGSGGEMGEGKEE
ncbi:hypothetical protein DFH09DRAFT_1273923 [Mycena vulgaris]|nr:hypothetical protein DFH09DRAFT_1273923 [Mycena vulgaris]